MLLGWLAALWLLIGCILTANRDVHKQNKTMAANGYGKHKMGIISGSGPHAGLNVMERILEEHAASVRYESDKDAPYILLVQEPDIGGPHGSWDLEDDQTPEFKLLWNGLVRSIQSLDYPKTDCFCLPCNTLHVLEPRIRKLIAQEGIKSSFVSIIDATKQAIETLMSSGSTSRSEIKLAIFGTLLTTDTDASRGGKSPYNSLCQLLKSPTSSAMFVTPAQEIRDRMQKLIIDVKVLGGDNAELQKECLALIQHLAGDLQANVIILACTEIPLMLKTESAKAKLSMIEKESEELIGMVDTNIALAKAMLKYEA